MTGQLHALLSPVKRPEVFTRAKIGTFAILGAECIPCAGTKNSVARNVVHVDRNSQQRRQRDKQVTDVTRRLDLGRSGQKVKNQEQKVIDKLTKLIEKIEQQQQQPSSDGALTEQRASVHVFEALQHTGVSVAACVLI